MSAGSSRRRVVVVLFVLAATAAAPASASAGVAERLGENVTVSRQDESGKVGFVGTAPGEPIETGAPASASAREVAKAFVREHAPAFGIDGSADGLRVSDAHRTLEGGTAVRLQQVSGGIPVLGAELIVNVTRSGDLLSVLGETSPSPAVGLEPAIAPADASAKAVATVARAQGVSPATLAGTGPKLQVYDPEILGAPDPTGAPRLAWVLEVRGTGAEPIRELVVVDAATGIVALHFDQIAEALHREICNANNTTSQVPCTAPVRVEGGAPVANDNDDVNLAYDFSGDTYDFFAGLGRDSLDGAGMDLISTVDFCRAGDLPELRERILERTADGLRRGVRRCRRRRRARAHPRGNGVQLAPLLLLPIGCDQRVDVRRLRRVHRPHERLPAPTHPPSAGCSARTFPRTSSPAVPTPTSSATWRTRPTAAMPTG